MKKLFILMTLLLAGCAAQEKPFAILVSSCGAPLGIIVTTEPPEFYHKANPPNEEQTRQLNEALEAGRISGLDIQGNCGLDI